MNHARLVCNQREKFQCAECRKLTSSGSQLIGEDETKFVCKGCYVNCRNRYPSMGDSIKHLLPADVVFSSDYDPLKSASPNEDEDTHDDVGYIGELVPDGNGGWREPTQDEIRAMQSREPAATSTTEDNSNEVDVWSTLSVKYRFTTDNKLQIVVPKRCRIDDRSYELVVVTDED